MPQKEKAQVAVNDEGLRKELFLLPMLKPSAAAKKAYLRDLASGGGEAITCRNSGVLSTALRFLKLAPAELMQIRTVSRSIAL